MTVNKMKAAIVASSQPETRQVCISGNGGSLRTLVVLL